MLMLFSQQKDKCPSKTRYNLYVDRCSTPIGSPGMAASLVASLLFTFLVVVPFCSLLLFLLTTKKPSPPRSNGRRLPPSPPGLPLLGHLPLLGSLPHRTLRSLAAAHGPVILLRFGRVPVVLVSSAAAAQEVLKTRDLVFASRPRVIMAERLLYGRDVAFAPYGEYWRQARRICVLHLLSPRLILSFRRLREQEASAMVDSVRAAARAPGAAVKLSELLISYSNAVVSRAAFGCSGHGLDGDGGVKLKEVFADFEGLLGTTPLGECLPWLGWVDWVTGLEGKVRRTFEAMDGVLEKVIADHRRRRSRRVGDGEQVAHDGGGDAVHRDFVDVLLDVNQMDEEAGILLDTLNIKGIIVDMFAAGTDTSYTVMEWVIAELINHPVEMRRLQDEIRAAVGADERVTEDHLEKMDFLKAVIKEILRLHTPVPLLVPRETLEDTELLGHHVPAQTRVVINAWAIGRDPATWERPDEFLPERFVDSPVDYRGQDFGLIPFGAGRRGCPGIGFAVSTLELAIASLLYHFDWEVPGGGRRPGSPPLDMTEVNGLSVRIKSGLHLLAKPWSR